jgi:hypothetical protein
MMGRPTKGLRAMAPISMQGANRKRRTEEVAMGLVLLDNSHKMGTKAP